MLPVEIIANALKEFWAGPKLAANIVNALTAEGYAITPIDALQAAVYGMQTPPAVTTIILGEGLITIEPIAQPDRSVAGILFKQLASAQPINEQVKSGLLDQAQPLLRIISTKPQSFAALCDVSDQAAKLFRPEAGKGGVVNEAVDREILELSLARVTAMLDKLVGECLGDGLADTVGGLNPTVRTLREAQACIPQGYPNAFRPKVK